MKKDQRSRRDFAQGAGTQSADRYKHALIVKPAIKLVISSALVLSILLFIPHFMESALGNIPLAKNSGQEFSIPRPPFFFYVLAVIATNLPLITKLVTGVITYNKWQQGDSPSCPECSGPMKIRTAKKGQFLGQRFWGCFTFPACRGKEHIGW